MKKKIGIVSPGVGGGADEMVYQLALGLYETGVFLPFIICPNPNNFYNKMNFRLDIPVIAGPEINQFHGIESHGYIEYSKHLNLNSKFLEEIFLRLNLDLVISSTNTFGEAAIASNRLDIPHVTWVQGYVSEAILGISFSSSQILLEKAQLCFSNQIVFVSEWAKKLSSYRYGQPVVGTVIHNWKHPISSPSSDNIQKNSIGYFGGFESHKGFIDLLKAAKEIKAELQDFSINVFSDSSPTQEISTYIRENDLQQNIFFNAKTQNPISAMEKCSVVVVPSRVESFSLVALESLVAGVPVVASKVGGLQEVIKDEVTGLTFNPGDYKTLANNVIALLKDKNLSNRLSAKGSDFAEKMFAPNTQVNKFIKVINEAIDTSSSEITRGINSNLFDFLEIPGYPLQRIEEEFLSTNVPKTTEFIESKLRFVHKNKLISRSHLIPPKGYVEYHIKKSFSYTLSGLTFEVMNKIGEIKSAIGIELVHNNVIVNHSEQTISNSQKINLIEFSFAPVVLAPEDILILRIFHKSRLPYFLVTKKHALSSFVVSDVEFDLSAQFEKNLVFDAIKFLGE